VIPFRNHKVSNLFNSELVSAIGLLLGFQSDCNRTVIERQNMKQLSLSEVGNLPSSVKTPTYSLSQVKAGIVHFGAGNFHRAHQAVYCESLLNEGNMEWGITGVSLRPKPFMVLLPLAVLIVQNRIGSPLPYRVATICKGADIF
jgi:hypothetical protein